jgi:hypothetical protein
MPSAIASAIASLVTDPTLAGQGLFLGVRVCDRLGEISVFRESGQLDRIITALQAHADGTWLNAAELDAGGAPGFGPIMAVCAVFVRLGLDERFDQVGGCAGRAGCRTRCS